MVQFAGQSEVLTNELHPYASYAGVITALFAVGDAVSTRDGPPVPLWGHGENAFVPSSPTWATVDNQVDVTDTAREDEPLAP